MKTFNLRREWFVSGAVVLVLSVPACSLDERVFNTVESAGASGDSFDAEGRAGGTGAGAYDGSSGANGMPNDSSPGSGGLAASATAAMGRLSAETSQKDFGAVEVHTTTPIFTWNVAALDAGPVEGLSLSWTNPDVLEVAENGCGDRIEEGQGCSIRTSLTPRVLGPIAARLTLSNGDGDRVDLSLIASSQVRLAVAKVGNGHVRSAPAGIDCGATCSALFDPGSGVELIAEPDPGSSFGGLDGVACASNVCTVVPGGSVQYTARFSFVNNLVFVTSEAFSPTLGASTLYDAECNRLASAAGFNTPTGDGFIAAMSDSTSSFMQRLRPGVRGWVRLDGKPFADTLEQLRLGVVYHPILFDEFQSTERWRVLTGTRPDGSLGDNCSDWTDPTGQVTTGYATGGPGWWLDSAPPLSCAEPLPVFCLGNASTAPLALQTASGKRIWLTDTVYFPGSMSPDEKCTQERPLGVGAARALVAYQDRGASSVLDPASNYVRPDGQLVGTGQQLIGGAEGGNWVERGSNDRVIQTGIWQSASGAYVAGSNVFLVWSGARDLIESAAPDGSCDDWTASTGTGYAGIFDQAQAQFWSRGGADNCTASAYLYCVEP